MKNGQCYTCDRAARWDVRCCGYPTTRQLACADHVNGLMDTKVRGEAEDHLLEVRRVE